jgi:hypothetical protein
MPPGNGLLLWFEVDDIDAAIARAEAMGADVLQPRHRNPPEGDGGPLSGDEFEEGIEETLGKPFTQINGCGRIPYLQVCPADAAAGSRRSHERLPGPFRYAEPAETLTLLQVAELQNVHGTGNETDAVGMK